MSKPFIYETNELGCHLVTSHHKSKDGYVKIFRNKKCISAHRYLYTEKFGEIPKDKVVMHKCDNPSCINLEHLSLGTQNDNVQDMISKNRSNFPTSDRNHAKGTGVKCSKLTEEDVLKIREDKRSQSVISKEYGISRGYVCQVRNNHTWRWL